MENLNVDEMNACLDAWITRFFQNNLLLFFEDLFNHVLQETEGLHYPSEHAFSYLPLALSVYQENVGWSIKRILTVAAADIDKLFETIKEKIQDRENLKIFLARLVEKFLCGPTEHELYFLTVISRIFVLVFKDGTLRPDAFTEEVAKIVTDHASKLVTTASFPASNIESLIENILKNPSSVDEFRKLKCGDASDYFS